ncbi:MAG: ATP-binding protein [Pirellulales bacterium]|nr:ATP-binding protein [Pirellulales bacterium]
MRAMMVFLGGNGVGKTNLLKAVDWLAAVSTSTSPIAWFNIHGIEVAVEFVVEDFRLRYEISSTEDEEFDVQDDRGKATRPALIENLLRIDNLDESETILSRRGPTVRLGDGTEYTIYLDLPALAAVRSLIPNGGEAAHCITEAMRFLNSIAYYPLDESSHTVETNVVSEQQYRHWKSQRDDSVQMRLLHLSVTDTETFEEIKQVVGVHGLNIVDEIEVFPLERSGTELLYIISFIPSGNTSSVRYRALALGTRRLLRLVVSVLSEKNSVSLIEHPEDAVHAQLLHKVMGFLRSYADPAQFFITSHSPSVFNTMRPEEVRSVSIKDGVTQVRALTADEQKIARDFVASEGSLADYLEVVESDG